MGTSMSQWHFDLGSFWIGYVAMGVWIIGVRLFIRVFMTKPRSMKQVAGDNSTQGCQVKGDSDE